MIAVFLIESELQLIIVSSLFKKNDIVIDISSGIDKNFIKSILKLKQIYYYKSTKVSRRNYVEILFFLNKIILNKDYELYTYSDESLYYRILNILSTPVKLNLIENGEKTYIASTKKRPLRFYLGNMLDFFITVSMGKKISLSYASNNIHKIVGFLPKNAYGIKQHIIHPSLCIWPKGRSVDSCSVLCIGLLRDNKNKDQIIKSINFFIENNLDKVYIKFHQRESQNVINGIVKGYKLIANNHSIESYFNSSKNLNIILNTKNSIYYYAKFFGMKVKLFDE